MLQNPRRDLILNVRDVRGDGTYDRRTEVLLIRLDPIIGTNVELEDVVLEYTIQSLCFFVKQLVALLLQLPHFPI